MTKNVVGKKTSLKGGTDHTNYVNSRVEYHGGFGIQEITTKSRGKYKNKYIQKIYRKTSDQTIDKYLFFYPVVIKGRTSRLVTNVHQIIGLWAGLGR